MRIPPPNELGKILIFLTTMIIIASILWGPDEGWENILPFPWND